MTGLPKKVRRRQRLDMTNLSFEWDCKAKFPAPKIL